MSSPPGTVNIAEQGGSTSGPILAGLSATYLQKSDLCGGNPSGQESGEVGVGRVLNSILLGIVTYDTNLLTISLKDLPA